MSNRETRRLDERGFASIVIALILIIVLALVTIGFAQLARREQRNALDKQLANQAYYAAETGINETIKALPAIAAAGSSVDSKHCLDTGHFSINPTVNQTNGVSFTCILVNLKPPNIQYKKVEPGSQRYINFSTDPSPLTSLTVSWTSYGGKNTARPNGGTLTPLSEWGDSPAVIEMSLTPTPSTQSNSTLAANTFSALLYPSSSAGGLVFSTDPAQQGQISQGGCHSNAAGALNCSVTISGIPASANGKYLLRLVDRYDTSTITITGQTAGGTAAFIGQPLIDVTGKAQEVLKRLQIRFTTDGNGGSLPLTDLPIDGLEVRNVCKRFSTDPTGLPGYDATLGDACKVGE